MHWKFWERWTPILRPGVTIEQASAVLDALYGTPETPALPPELESTLERDLRRQGDANRQRDAQEVYEWQRRTAEAQAAIAAWTQGLIENHPANQPKPAEPIPPRKKTVLAILGGGMYVIAQRHRPEYERHGWRYMGPYGAPNHRQIVMSAPTR